MELKKGNFISFRNVKLKDNQPDYKGEINIDGVYHEIVMWIKEDKNGDQFISGSVNEKKSDKLQTGKTL